MLFSVCSLFFLLTENDLLKLKKKLQEDMTKEIRKDYPKPKIKTEECTRWFSSYDPGTPTATILVVAAATNV